MAVNDILTIPAGQTSGTISITVINDLLPEETETFAVNLSNAVNVTLIDSQGIGTILDSDPYLVFLPVVIRP